MARASMLASSQVVQVAFASAVLAGCFAELVGDYRTGQNAAALMRTLADMLGNSHSKISSVRRSRSFKRQLDVPKESD